MNNELSIDKINLLCREIADTITEERMNEYADELDMEMLLANPRFYGPDCDDCDGPWYWEVK
jgi:hypothetical protein